jgi:hypothetical protein
MLHANPACLEHTFSGHSSTMHTDTGITILTIESARWWGGGPATTLNSSVILGHYSTSNYA